MGRRHQSDVLLDLTQRTHTDASAGLTQDENMRRAIIDIAAQRMAAAMADSNDADPVSIFSEILRQMVTEPVAATLRSIEQTRDALAKAIEVVVSASGHDALSNCQSRPACR